MFTKFGLILSIRSQDVEQKPNSDVNQRFTIPTYILSMMMFTQNLVLFCQLVLNDMTLSKTQILTSIKGRKSVANLRKTMIYNTNVVLVNNNVHTKCGLNRSIRFRDIEQKLNSDVNQGP